MPRFRRVDGKLRPVVQAPRPGRPRAKPKHLPHPSPLPEGEGAANPMDALRSWFGARGWTPYPFQEEAWAAYARGESGLIHVPTGAGKTYAAYLAPLAEVAARGERGLQILYLTPLR